MKSKIKKYTKEIIVFSLMLIIISNVVSYFKSSDLNKAPLTQNSFTLIDGTKYKISDKPLMIYFWATWCPICKIQSPNIQRLSKDYEVITIAVQSGNEYEIEEYLQKENLDFKVINDFDGSISKQFNIGVYPTTLIYNSKKELVFSDVGYTSTIGLYLRMMFSKY
jgi:thiol-disulfide isomerase/thioredoxin